MDAKRLVKYLIITFGITWACWLGDALLVKSTSMVASDALPMILFTLGGFGPTIAACVCMENGFTKAHLKRFLFNNKRRNWLLLCGMLILESALFYINSDGLLDSIPKSPAAMIVALVVFVQAALLFGGNEELGWRGTMQPILQKKFQPPLATLMVGAAWVLWHIPLWLIEGDSHQSMSFVSFAVLGMALAYWLAATYNRTGAVVFCMIMHGWTNTLMGILNIKENAAYYICIAIMTAISIAIGWKPFYPTAEKE